ncbi:hypothetical protein NP493_80g03052 [Ridgeia piscesae]|uniref:Uncharacterized protein n=1 Tax=Ridgeia piscesae TaxID=27915 RepID=A0AAD9P8Z5_RIDPI|nr:hypothetical protein NP493_80g03052 [Ridgeia piscesae]
MGSIYLKNRMGTELTDEEMKDIPNPKTELTIHVTTRVVQAFGLLSTVLIGPLAAVAKAETRNLAGIARKVKTCGKYGVLLGFVIGPGMTVARMNSLDADGIYDRCYRLRNNENQRRVDQSFVVATPAGAVVAAATGSSPILGALLGMTGAVFAVAAYNQSLATKKNVSA